MIYLASDVAATVAQAVSPLIPKVLPPLHAAGYRWFPIAMTAALALLAWTIWGYDPGSASHDGDHGDH
jgi:hypothetical protein